MSRTKEIELNNNRYQVVFYNKPEVNVPIIEINKEIPRKILKGTKWKQIKRCWAWRMEATLGIQEENPIELAKKWILREEEENKKHENFEKKLDEWFS